MRNRRLRHGSSLLLGALAVGCGVSEERRVVVSVAGGLRADLIGDRLSILAADGRVLLDGLAPGTIAEDAPPLVGFAVRDIETEYEMKYGSFRPNELPNGPWRVATRFAVGENGNLELRDAGDALLASLSFTSARDGQLDVATTAGPGAKRLSWGIRCDAEDHFAGFGAQTWDVDHRGQTVFSWVQEEGIGKSDNDEYTGAWYLQGRRHSSHAPLPEFLARRGYVLAVHTERRATFALCSESPETARLEFELGAKVSLFDGPSPAEALKRAGAELGRPRMPPRVSFAPWLDAIRGSAEVRRVATKLRAEKIPSSVLWTEDWRGAKETSNGYSLEEEWAVDTSLYPDFAELANDLHASGFGFYVYFNPFIYKGSKAYAEAQPAGHLVKREDGTDYLFPGAKFSDTGLLDVFEPKARAWAVGKMRDAIALGADGWMHDFAEWLPTDAKTAAGSGADTHNRYPVAWQEIAREAVDGVKDGIERVFFVRSGWLGTPALTDVFWAGDQRTSMDVDDGLPTILPIGIGLGIVGISTYGHDIAGYQSTTNPGSTKEVFFRWTEVGAWTPVMRTHHGQQASKNWSWEKDADTVGHFRRYAEHHMALMPWFEGLAREAADTSMPIWRGMFLHYPSDAATWPITDQVMVGSHVLLAPVMTAGATSRSVYLPAGRWFPWSGGAPLDGAGRSDVSAPLEEIPVFVRAGAIVPTFPPGAVMTASYPSKEVPGPESVGDDRVLHVFLGDSSTFAENGGALTYRLEQRADASGPLTFAYDGKPLASCGVPAAVPCFSSESEGLAVVRLTGPGTLSMTAGEPVADLTIAGGAASRSLTVRIRHR